MVSAPIRSSVQPDPLGVWLRGKYKSIGDLSWDDIPPLVVLTGVNGSGKTQLLEALHLTLASDSPEKSYHRGAADIVGGYITGAIAPADVVYVPSGGGIVNPPPTNGARLEEYAQELAQYLDMPPIPVHLIPFQARLEAFAGERATLQDIMRLLLSEPELLLGQQNAFTGLANLFVAYQADQFHKWQEDPAEAGRQSDLGLAPWDVLNRILEEAQFPYRVNSPKAVKLYEAYEFRLIGLDGKVQVQPTDLSSGERAFLSIVLWLYRSRHYGALPKLLLLDEPDAHLHPSLAKQFVDVLANVLVGEYGVRVIFTTHSPSTVALAPEGSIYEMRPTDPRIVRSTSKWSTVGLLTSGVVTVGPDTKYVFVEDEDDGRFFDVVRTVLSREPGRLPPAPSLVFIPASKGRESGGKTRVHAWTELLAGSSVHGIVDRDAGNSAGDRLHVLGRYEVENYLLDPLTVFTYLIEHRAAPAIAGVPPIPLGAESRLATLSSDELQRVVDYVLKRVQPAVFATSVTVTSTKQQEVCLLSGQTLLYPEWFMLNKGKGFMGAFQKEFRRGLNWDMLRLSWERAGLVPAELLEILRCIQSS